EITQITLNAILKIKFKGNIGECKNVIKYACGRAYAKNQRRNGKRLWDNVKIESAKGKTGFEKIKLSYFAFHKFYSVEPSLLCLM
ncbi:hypothetical protein ACTPEF_25150, partial [Clostridioides difficile]